MFHNLALMAATQLGLEAFRARADECQQTADCYPTDLIGQEYAGLARQWQALAQRAGEAMPPVQ